MTPESVIQRLRNFSDRSAIIWNNRTFSFSDMLSRVERLKCQFGNNQLTPGMVVAVVGDFSPNTIAILFLLICEKCITVPLSKIGTPDIATAIKAVGAQLIISISDDDKVTIQWTNNSLAHIYYDMIQKRKHAGLILFSSGTSGTPKAAVHDFFYLLRKFDKEHRPLRTINFLLFDHWGGLNTLFHTLLSGGTVIFPDSRSPNSVVTLMAEYKVELLPTTPTFLNLLLIDDALDGYDLSSLKVISYGTEPMPKHTLDRIKKALPSVRLLQTYGLIEVGVLHTKSENDNSVWFSINDPFYKIRIRNGLLEIKTKSTMLGYLNHNSPTTTDGWFMTGDRVIQKDSYIQILGRESELINVAGEKVYPAEVENVVLSLNNVAEATVYPLRNQITGYAVGVNVKLIRPEGLKTFRTRLRAHCKTYLKRFQIPVKIDLTDNSNHSSRFKKNREN
jgi:acyl-CoA synthetase (AMP-forming)/AMP-acid ligase II